MDRFGMSIAHDKSKPHPPERHALGPQFARTSSGGDADRQREREREERVWAPVVIKRSDQAVRHPDDTLQLAIQEGVEQSERSSASLFLSAVAAGAILSFSVLAVAVAVASGDNSGLAGRLAIAATYPIGFVLCVMSGTQLFTEHTALALYPALDRRCRFLSVLRVWALVLIGNFVGCGVGAALLLGSEPLVEASAGYEYLAHHVTDAAPWTILISAVLAGWLMALGGWLVLSTPPDLSQIVVIYAVTFTIGFAGLHHAIAGATELMMGMLVGGDVGIRDAVSTLSIVVPGNLMGGAVFVALLNYGHIRKLDS